LWGGGKKGGGGGENLSSGGDVKRAANGYSKQREDGACYAGEKSIGPKKGEKKRNS